MSNWFSIRAAKDGQHEILIYDQIGTDWFGNEGVSAKQFAEALKDIPAGTPITVAINSPGGNVWDGLAIYHQLEQRKDKVTVRVDGVAASIASIIALAGSRLIIPENSLYMIHDPSGMVAGTADEMREMADRLEQHADILAGIYSKKTGKTKEAVRQLMADETWMNGREAVLAGFADETSQPVRMAANFNFHPQFRHVPEALVAKQTQPPQTPSGGHQEDKMQTQPTTTTSSGPVAAVGVETPVQVIDHAKDINAIQAALKRERELRITAEFRALAQHRPTLNETEWLPRVIADETIMDSLRKLPVEAAAPVKPSIENLGNPAIETYRAFGPSTVFVNHEVPAITAAIAKKRTQWRRDHGAGLEAQLKRFAPMNANTVSSTLKPDVLADAVVTVATNKLAPLNAFSRLFSADIVRPGASVQVKKATAGSTGQTDPTNFESGDSTLAPISVTMNHKTQSFQVSGSDRNYGFSLEDIAQVNANAFANLLSDVYTAVITTTNFGTALTVGIASNFDSADLPPILGAAKNYRQKNLLLDGGHLAYLLPTDRQSFALGEQGAYGFDIIAEQNRWTGATTNTCGFVCSPDAIAVASGMPNNPASDQFELNGTFLVAPLGLTVMYTVWFNTATRVQWASYECVFGAAAGDTTSAEVLITA
jgi:ATP-dependent protease ClpP protease subunit